MERDDEPARVPELLTVEAALERIVRHASLLEVEGVPIEAALGRVVREPARALVDLPPFPSSAMDGFAVRATETPGELPVAFRVAAGGAAETALAPGTAAGIATGGTVPDGADAVVPVELAEDRGDVVVVRSAVKPGHHVRPRGGDVHVDDVVVAPGSRLGPAQIGALAAAGVAVVSCSARPRVAILATGSELRSPGRRARGRADLRVEPTDGRRCARRVRGGHRRAARSLPTIPLRIGARSSAVSKPMCSSRPAVSRWGRTISCAGRPRSSVSKRSSGASRSSQGSRLRSEFAARRSSSGSRGTRCRHSSARSSSSARHFSLVRVLERPRPSYARGTLSKPLRRNPDRDEFVRARRIESRTASTSRRSAARSRT